MCVCVCFYFTHLPEKSYKELDEVHNTVVLGEGDLRKREGRRGEEKRMRKSEVRCGEKKKGQTRKRNTGY